MENHFEYHNGQIVAIFLAYEAIANPKYSGLRELSSADAKPIANVWFNSEEWYDI